VSRASRRGLVRKIAPRVYTTDTTRDVAEIIENHAIQVASLRYPGAVLSHRTAFEMRPGDGHLFLTGSYEATDRLPGLTIRLVRGPEPQPDDRPVLDLYRASDARAYLENLSRTRTVTVSRVLPRQELERRLEAKLRQDGEDGLNALRDRARELAPILGAEDAFETLDELIGTLLLTREAPLVAPTAVARAAGEPFDDARISLFEALAEELEQPGWRETSRPRPPMLREERQNLAFIDAYFSNFIEGTKFAIDEATDIVFNDVVPESRPRDAHDIRGTFDLLVDRTEMTVSAVEFETSEDFGHLLKRRHRRIMQARPESRPGEFKEEANKAGNTLFVLPELVEGTLSRGFEILKSLSTPFQRAAFVMFLVSEVHPFDDGNGRLARAMMNAELEAAEENHIVIVTAYREDYLGALRRLSRRDEARTYLRMLDRAQELVSRLQFEKLPALLETLGACNAFDDTGRRIMKLPRATV
jgi:fido (protein-threonine AMPylation protein)